MLTWIAENIATILVSAVLIAIVAAVLAVMIRNGKKGKSPCGCNCGSCAMSGACHGARKAGPKTGR